MSSDVNTLRDLAVRAARGDRLARTDLEVQMVPLVREALGGRGNPAFQKRVRATAGQLARYAPEQPPDRERLARRVALCLCDSLVEGLARAPSSSQRLQETVLA
jgi:hypothetical protein